jgi:hypothetical protein
MDLKQKLIDSATFSNFKTLEEIKEKIKTFMLATTYNENYEDWTQRLENGVEIHHIQVFKFIIEVNEEEVEEEPNKNPLFKVSIYTETVTIRYGGSLWNQFEFCLDALTEYLDKQNLEPDHENLEWEPENLEPENLEPENLEWAPEDLQPENLQPENLQPEWQPLEENEVEGEQDIPWYDEGKNAELDAKLEALYNAEPTMMEMTLSEPDYVRSDF